MMFILYLFQEEGNNIFSWLERGQLRDKCTIIPSIDRETLREWLGTVFKSEEDGYQPPGEDVRLEMIRESQRSPQKVQFMCPEMDRT